MTGAMYAAIAGLRTHMSNLNVIGNNIANVNTSAYKSQRSVFRTALYTTQSGGSNGTTTTGGVNPSQIGYGASLATIDKDMSTGNYGLTGKSTDCMIDGDGFFLVGDKTVADQIDPTDPDTFKSLTLTRVGDFEFKSDGYLTDGLGNVVYGFACVGKDKDGNAILSDQLVPLRLPKMVTDDDGNVTIIYPKADDSEGSNGRLQDCTSVDTDENGNITGSVVGGTVDTLDFAIFDSVTIDKKTGLITGITDDDQNITVGYIALGVVTNPNGVLMESDSYYKCDQGAGDMKVVMLGGAAQDVIVTTDPTTSQFDYDQYSLTDTDDTANGGTNNAPGDNPLVKGLHYVNGYWAVEQHDGITLGEDGSIEGLTENAKVAGGGTRKLITGGLEMSKTDLAKEISDLIVTQRGYQANTRIVTVTDSMLEELVNMKR